MSTPQARQPDNPPAENPQARQIQELLLVGYRPQRVATKLGIPLAEVQAAQVQAAQSALDQAQSPEAEEAARRTLLLTLRVVREEALEAWEASKEQGEKTVTRCGAEDGKPGRVTKRTRKHSGDPRYLDRITRAVAVESRLRTLDTRPPASKTNSANAASTAGKPGTGSQTEARKKLTRAEMAAHDAYEDIMRAHPANRYLHLSYVHKHLMKLIEENTPLVDLAEIESLLSQIKRYLSTHESSASPSAESATPAVSPFYSGESRFVAPAAVVDQPDDKDEDEDEDAYLAERYGDDATHLRKPATPAQYKSGPRAPPAMPG